MRAWGATIVSARTCSRLFLGVLLGGLTIHWPLWGATFVVTNAADAGPATLRQALLDANANPGFDTIRFQIAGAGPHTLLPRSALPTVQDSVAIDGTSQPGYLDGPIIELAGASAGINVSGLRLLAGGSTVRGLAINRFSGDGIRLEGAGTNVLAGNYLGLAPDGETALRNAQAGVAIAGSAGNRVGGTNPADRNVISGNGASGVYIVGGGASNNVVEGNFIGVDVSGRVALSNAFDGVTIEAAPGNRVGGTTRGSGNVISGNGLRGVTITLAGADRNRVEGNLIGTDAGGQAALGNRWSGVSIFLGSSNVVGGTAAGARNVISGNGQSGVLLLTNATTGNAIQGNYIGVDVTGTNALGNLFHGVSLDGASSNVVGGAITGTGNVISGNQQNGVMIGNATATGNAIQGNLIGTDATGRSAVGNAWAGVRLTTAGNEVGGRAAAARNLISGNQESGLFLSGSGCTSNLVEGNFIGTDAGGTYSVSNLIHGINISDAPANVIGGTAVGAGNLISGNSFNGISLSGSGAYGNVIEANRVGIDAAGVFELGNLDGGIYFQGAPSNRVGGTMARAGNLVSGNRKNAIKLNPGADGNVIQGNIIGTRADRVSPLGNEWHGIDVNGARFILIGGGEPGAGNVIACAQTSGYDGVRVRLGSVAVSVLGNSIFANGGASPNGLAIDLEPDGVNSNDRCDADGGANGLQNTPVVAAALSDGRNTRSSGVLDSVGNAIYTIQLYASLACDPSGNGEGQMFLGTAGVTIGSGCATNFSATVPAGTPSGWAVTATATDADGNTSEFSNCAVTAPAPTVAAEAGAWGAVTISWPASAGAWLLMENTNLTPPAAWWPATNAPVELTNGQYRVTLAATNAQRFYRLLLP